MEEKRSSNLCSIYILPLIGLNRQNFGSDNFVSCKVSEDNSYLVVEVKHITTIINHHSAYKFGMKQEENTFAVFEIPEHFKETVVRFREGKYSKFSEEAKTMIRKKSGLKYKAPQANGTIQSARELLALDKAKELKRALEEELKVEIEDGAELASIPGEDNFIQLNISTSIPTELVNS